MEAVKKTNLVLLEAEKWCRNEKDVGLSRFIEVVMGKTMGLERNSKIKKDG